MSLGEVVRARTERVDPGDAPEEPFIGLEHVEAHTMRLVGKGAASDVKSSANRFREGDVLYARLRPYLNKVLKAPFAGLCSAEFAVLEPSDAVTSDFLARRLNASDVVAFAMSFNTGVHRPRIRWEQLREFMFGLPPCAEQDRIVRAIEAQEARIGDGGRSLAQAAELATALNQAIVDAAAARAHGTVRTLEDCLLEPLMNGRSVRTAPEGFPVLRLTALKHGHIDASEAKVGAWTESEASPYLISAGDFLIARGNGSLDLVGRGGLVEDNPPPIAFPDTLIRVRVNPDVLRHDFLRLVWDSRKIRAQIETQARTTAGIYKINQGHVRALQLPVPGLDEQDHIVSRTQSQVAALDELLTALARQSRTIAQLRRSLLNRAFSGSLATQGPDDEPASVRVRTMRREDGITKTKLELAGS